MLDGEVEHCWGLIRTGIQAGKLDIASLRALIGKLRAGDGMVLDGLAIEVMPPGSARARVGLAEDERTCAAPKLIDELARLVERANAVPLAEGAPDHDTTAGSPPEGISAGAAPGSSAASASGRKDTDLLGLLAGLLGTTPEQLERDPSVLRAHVERVRAATAAAARAGDLETALRALGVAPELIPAALRTVVDWLERRTSEAGAAVDRMIAALETAATSFVGRLSPDAATTERDERIRAAARASIAARLKPPSS